MFVGVAVDPSIDQINAFIDDTGVGGFTHLTGDDANRLAAEHGVAGIPHFVFVNDDGQTDTMTGWSAGQAQNKIDWLQS